MPLIKCPECGHLISDKATQCPKCGLPKTQPFVKPQPGETKSRKYIFLSLSAIIVVVIVVGGIWWLKDTKSDISTPISATQNVDGNSAYLNFQTPDLQTFELHDPAKEVSADGETFIRFDSEGRLTYIDFGIEKAEEIEGYRLGLKFLIIYGENDDGIMADENGNVHNDFTRTDNHITTVLASDGNFVTWDYDSKGRRISTSWNNNGAGEERTLSDFTPNGIHQKVTSGWSEPSWYSEGEKVGVLCDFVLDDFGNWTSMRINFGTTERTWTDFDVFGSDNPKDYTVTRTTDSKKVIRNISYYSPEEIITQLYAFECKVGSKLCQLLVVSVVCGEDEIVTLNIIKYHLLSKAY